MIEPAPSNDPLRGAPRGRAGRSAARGVLPPLAALAAAVALGVLGGAIPRPDRPAGPAAPASEARQGPPVEAETAEAALAAPAPGQDALRQGTPWESPPWESTLWQGTLGGPLSRWAWTGERPAVEPAPAEAPPIDTPPAETTPDAPPRTVMTVPLPVPRPPELRRPADPVRRAERHARRQAAATPPPPPEDNRSFLEKLFGVESPPARSYTALESRPVDPTPRPRLSPPLAPPSAEGGTAVYNIAARTVTLPGGERMEAHSGLGELMDDPRNVHVRMRGATPPGTYVLTEREQLFHGVRAIRLTPVGGPDAVYGRVGLLAHTFMLGPTGASNGCISFRDYDRFLQAFLRGEVQRVVVVTGTSDPLPSLAQQGAPVRMARAGE